MTISPKPNLAVPMKKSGGVFGSIIQNAATLSGSVLTITGSGFGAKASPSPKKYSNFSGITEGQSLDVYDADWVRYNNNAGALATTLESYSGGACVLNRIGSAHPDGGRGEFDTNFVQFTSEYGKPVRGVYKHKIINGGPAYGVRKHARIGSNGPGGGGGPYNGALVSAFSNGQFMYTNSRNTATDYWNRPSSGYIDPGFSIEGGWITIIHTYVPNSEEGVADGINRLEIFHPTGGYYKAEDSAAEPLILGDQLYSNTFLLGLMVANADADAGSWHTVYEDNVYVDNDLALVAVTDAATIEGSNFFEAQVCDSWSDSEIVVNNFEQGRLSSGTRYVHVWDSSGSLVQTTEVTL